MPSLPHARAEEGVGDLEQDARAVAVQRIGARRARCVRLLEDLEALRDDVVALPALDVRDEADAARVVLVCGVVESLRGGGHAVGGLTGELPLSTLTSSKNGWISPPKPSEIRGFTVSGRNPPILRAMLQCDKTAAVPSKAGSRTTRRRLPAAPRAGKTCVPGILRL